MVDEAATAARAVEQWLVAFEGALNDPRGSALRALFHDDSHWRDVLALTWRIETVNGSASLSGSLREAAERARPRGFRIDASRTPPRRVKRAGREAIEAILAFETEVGRCNAVLRLTPSGLAGEPYKAWTLATVLDEIEGHEENVGRRRPSGQVFSRDFRGPNWLDRRKSAAAYADRDPAVLVVGGGQAGLAIAARLGQLGIDTLMIERNARIGDNWRNRYHALTLHNQVHVNHFPYMPFPPGWPTYLPKDKLAGWFEAYAELMEINTWTGTELEGGEWDERAACWNVAVRRADGTRRSMRPRHVVMATGASDTPNIPDIPTLEAFKGTVVHSGHFGSGDDWAGKRALVIGTGTSGHDIAQDLHASGASVTVVQRSSTMVVNIEPSAQLPYTLYEEGPPLADCDLLTVGLPFPVLKRAYQILTAEGARIDKPLLDRLAARGFRLDLGEEDTGWQMKYLTRGGGYYFNVGCSDLIADAKIGLVQSTDIATFEAGGARLRNGDRLAADLVVLATGYKGQEELVRRLFGAEIADRVGPIWGFGDGQELRNMFARTPQPGLWFMAGSFAQCRIYSKYLALAIVGVEAGVLTD